jgi:hypothetical protein
MARCCERLSTSTLPTDALITPLVQLSELAARVNEFFSYDDLENAEFGGNMMLELATNNFRTELERIQDSTQRIAVAKESSKSFIMLAVKPESDAASDDTSQLPPC